MNQSIWERRQAVASRLEGHVRQERLVRDEFEAALATASLDASVVDPDGHLGRAVTAVAALAADSPGFDVVLGLSSGGHGVRVHAGPDGRAQVQVVELTAHASAPTAVASELAALLWQR
ncbi:hypothetical protein AB2L27_12585 [Kineococcus sp. LSe6-4]|uniref:Uncharacterized protein n=1 Tax=Kineococcus halophytocola TaxID=3234027 RepID=A0ABV4H5C0_9ACTN